MGGHLGHRENPGGGSVFWLELPSGVADQPVMVADEARTSSRRELRVLVVDDSEVIAQRDGRRSWNRRDTRQPRPTTALEAVRLAATDDFDLVLMDMRMHGMDGLEATKQIKALAGSRGQVPIVAMTANALDQHAEECHRAGMVGAFGQAGHPGGASGGRHPGRRGLAARCVAGGGRRYHGPACNLHEFG